MSEWEPIEGAEKDGTNYLLWDGEQVYLGYWVKPLYSWNEGNWWAEGGQITIHPTHRMPLPAPPKDESC